MLIAEGKRMNTDDIDKHIALMQSSKIQRLEHEFEKLRPSGTAQFFRAIFGIFILLGIITLFPQILAQPISYLLLFLIFLVAFGTYYESHRVNKRLDTLYHLLKNP
ncbi:hypothetical protein HG263_13085 [Pseudoalteromonas sp. JBTF-M23]|uniref:DUF202 domain-containing protein n=1 Tax=Pseudoalteromonas caenipelagi TaxID=2726988 RepID=A0A849VEA5_9GAMM|nr:hypothetical protein [Pseudoalteromonas caenipelagi]NOU51465.1 hypothetical protein [Pseudoalteromonas caenipelagi]